MTDPLTILQVVGTVVSLGDAVIKCISRLSALKAQFHNAPIIVTSMIGQLHMVNITQDQLSRLNIPKSSRDPRYRQLGEQIGNALDSFGPILLALGQQLDRYEGGGAGWMTVKSRLGFVNDERQLTNLSILLDRQVNALSLLLQAIQCQTWTEQSQIISQSDSQSILRLAQDCSSSLVGLDDVASFISENTAAISAEFEFDDILQSTMLYQTAERSHLRQAIRARIPRTQGTASTNTSVRIPVIYGFKHAFRAIRLIKPTALFSAPDIQQRFIDLRRNVIAERHSEVEKIGPPKKKAKILLLGVSGSGKTTLSNGLQLFADAEQIAREEKHFRTLIWQNALESARDILRAMERLNMSTELTRWDRALLLEPWSDSGHDPALDPQHAIEIARAVSFLRLSPEFKRALRSRNAYRFHTNCEYYIDRINYLAEGAARHSMPTEGDFLRTQVITTGIHQMSLTYRDTEFNVYDFGGERSERKKWIHAFHDVSAIIYPVDTVCYGRALREDEDGDQMKEQLMIFESLANSDWFKTSSFIVVFTKIDLLAEYLKDCDVDTLFNLGGVEVMSNNRPRVITANEYLNVLEEEFRGLVRPGLGPGNLQFIRTNLVDIERHNPGLEILDAVLESFRAPMDAPISGVKLPLLSEEIEGLPQELPAIHEDEEISWERWSSDAGQRPADDDDEARSPLVGIAR
ncbi:G-protein alpha subunit-domain-containing protein [Nemania sp. FL0916]|nr:G-protein alpha subunit-domain-containing protein [Nemania sp. FL0916]